MGGVLRRPFQVERDERVMSTPPRMVKRTRSGRGRESGWTVCERNPGVVVDSGGIGTEAYVVLDPGTPERDGGTLGPPTRWNSNYS